MVLFWMLVAPPEEVSAQIPPPSPVAEFPVIVELLTVRVLPYEKFE